MKACDLRRAGQSIAASVPRQKFIPRVRSTTAGPLTTVAAATSAQDDIIVYSLEFGFGTLGRARRAHGEKGVGAKPGSLRLGRGHAGGGLVRGLCNAGVYGGEVSQPGPPPALTPLSEQNGLSAQRTLPRIVTEERVDPFLQETLPHHAAHFGPAFRTLHASSSRLGGDGTPDGPTHHFAISRSNRFSARRPWLPRHC